MTTEAPAVPNTSLADALPRGATPLFAAAVGLIVINLFGIQPLVAEIAASIGWTTAATGLLVTATLVGYGIGVPGQALLTDGRRVPVWSLITRGQVAAEASAVSW